MEKGEDGPPGSPQAKEHHLHQDQHYHPYMYQTGGTGESASCRRYKEVELSLNMRIMVD
ncbi:hypothetical protein DPMN_172006 [Dreissena polymorpha]|nr:hypothetical protein DPMN_172006 [Dreissena polymorpha]